MNVCSKATESSKTSKTTGNKNVKASVCGQKKIGWPSSKMNLGFKQIQLKLSRGFTETKSCENENDSLDGASRKTMREIIQAQKSTIEYWAARRSSVERESKDLSKAQKLYSEAHAQIESLHDKLEKTRKQLGLAQGEVEALHENANDLIKENDELCKRNSELKKSNALLRFHYASRPLLDFPHLQPRDNELEEGDLRVGKYQFLEQLGSGQLGTVFASKNSSNEDVAIKKVDKRKLYDFRFVLQLNDEIKSLKVAKPCVNIVQLKETLHGDKFYYLVFEKGHSDLHSYSAHVEFSEEDLR
mmetsp:Transcript_14217/g.39410  ORF Transcript_14217/g.39410 Transcript_14217/m.39410 type:complete len:301 (-) Transcript_14217:2939-3841(-)